MSYDTKVEQRIVQMKFDNKGFAAGVENTLGALQSLQNGILNAENLTKALGKVDFASLTRTLEDVGYRFSTMGIMATTVLQNIATEAYYTAKNIASSLSTDQIFAGWNKYNDKTIAVQTIMSATGKSIQEVEAELEKLQWFTDETSYNFVDMVGNIGKFTSAGMKLEDSRVAMEGIALWAARSGVNATDASRAMFQLSQAISMGAIKGNDWASIESLTMATDEFKNKVLETAVAMGKLEKVGNKFKAKGQKGTHLFDANSFRSFLSDNWFDKDLFMKVMKMYGEYADKVKEFQETHGIETAAEAMEQMGDAGDAFGKAVFEAGQVSRTFEDAVNSVKDAVSSGWSQTWQLVFGDLEEAKELWGDFAERLWDVFAASGETRNEMLQLWKDLGGRETLIQSFRNTWDTVKETIDNIKAGFQAIIPPMTGEKLRDITDVIYRLSDTLKSFNDDHMGDFFIIGKGIGSVVDIIVMAIKKLLGYFNGVTDAIGEGEPLFESVIRVLTKIADLFIRLDERIKEKGFIGAFKETLEDIVKAIPGFISGITDHVLGALERLGIYLTDLSGIKFDSGPFTLLGSAFEKIFGAISGNMPDHIHSVSEALEAIFKTVSAPAVKVFEWFSKVFGDFSNAVGKGFTWTFEKLGKAFSWVSEQFGKFSKYITSLDMVELFKLVTVMAKIGDWTDKILGIGKYANAADRTKKYGKSVFDIFKGVADTLENADYWSERIEWMIGYANDLLNHFTRNLQIFAQSVKAGTVLEIAGAIFLLAQALKTIAEIPADQLGNAVSGMAGLVTAIGFIAAVFSKLGVVDKKDGLIGIFGKVAGNRSVGDMLMSLAISMIMLAGAMKIMSTIKWEDMKSGMAGFAEALIGILVFINMLSGSKSLTKTIAGDTTKVVKGTKAGTFGAIAMIFALANAMLLLSVAMKILSTIDQKTLIGNLVQLGALLGGIFLFINNLDGYSGKTKTNNVSLIHGTKGATMGAIGMILALANAMVILSVAMKILSTIDVPGIAKGLISIGSLMVALYFFIEKLQGTSEFSKFSSTMKGDIGSYAKSGSMSSVSGTKGGVFGIFAGVLLLSVGILILAAAMKVIETIDVNGIIKGLGTIGGLLVEIFAFMWGLSAVVQSNGYQLMMAAGAIQTVAVAMLTLVAGLVVLWLIPVDEINKSLGIMATTLIGVGAFLKIISQGAALDLIASGGSFALVAAGIVMIALSLLMIANIPSTALYNAEVTLLTAVGGVAAILAVLTAMVQNGSVLDGAAALSLISVGLVGLALGLKVLSQVDPWKAAGGLLVLAGAIVVLGLSAAVLGGLIEFMLPGALVMLALGAACYVLAAALKVLGVALEAIGKGISSVIQGLLEGLAMLINFITLTSGAIGLFNDKEVNMQLIDVNKIRGNEAGEAYIEGYKESVANADYKEVALENATNITTSIDEANAQLAPQSGYNFAELLGTGFEEGMPNLEQMTLDANGMMTENLNQFDPKGTYINQFYEQILDKQGDIKDISSLINSDVIKELGSNTDLAEDKGMEMFQNYLKPATGQGMQKDIKEASKEFNDHVFGTLKQDSENPTFEYGSNIAIGTGEALNDSKTWGKLDTQIHRFSTELFRKLCKEAGISSPSKVAEEKVGKWIPAGIGQGMVKYAGVLGSAGGDMMDSLFGALATSLQSTDRLISSNLTLDPTITPFLDLSQIQNGAGQIDSILGGFSVNGTINGLSMANGDIMASIAGSLAGNDKHSERVVLAIDSLKKDVKNLGEYVSGLEIRLDSGALVGGIASPMDKQLGIRAARNRRERPR